MKIIIGLGNPGEKYINTRHNVGFAILDAFREKYDFPTFEFNKKFNSDMSSKKFEIQNSKLEILLFKPHTFMNNSGEAVKAVLDFYKLTPADIIVIHDDLDIAVGKYKVANDSSSAGHNGVQDIIDKIGTQKFNRIRIGIDKNETIPAEDYVLQKFMPEEMKKVENISENILEEIKKLL